MVSEKDEKKEEEVVVKPEKSIKKVQLAPEQIESRQRAHDLKVQKFLSGGVY